MLDLSFCSSCDLSIVTAYNDSWKQPRKQMFDTVSSSYKLPRKKYFDSAHGQKLSSKEKLSYQLSSKQSSSDGYKKQLSREKLLLSDSWQNQQHDKGDSFVRGWNGDRRMLGDYSYVGGRQSRAGLR